MASVKCSQLCWVSSLFCVLWSVHLIYFSSAFIFTFGRSVCGLVWSSVRSIQRPQRRNQEQIWKNGDTVKKNRNEQVFGMRENSITSLHFLYILWWRIWRNFCAQCITCCLWTPILFMFLTISSWYFYLLCCWKLPAPLCAGQHCCCCPLLVIFM